MDVSLVTAQWLADYVDRKKAVYYGIYDDDIKAIFLDKALPLEVKRHALYHEIGHHILMTLEDMEGLEDKCDVLGAYIMALVDAKVATEAGLKKK